MHEVEKRSRAGRDVPSSEMNQMHRHRRRRLRLHGAHELSRAERLARDGHGQPCDAVLFAWGLAACAVPGPAANAAQAAQAADIERLFDDALEPPTVGITLGSYEAPDETVLPQRARLAEAIYRAQITGILPMAAGGWLVELTTTDVLRGGALAPTSLEVEIPAGSPSAALVEHFRPNFERAHLLVFARRFARINERTQWHVHTVADTAESRESIERAIP